MGMRHGVTLTIRPLCSSAVGGGTFEPCSQDSTALAGVEFGRRIVNVELVTASQRDRKRIQNLARFYVYDLSEYAGWPCPDDGLYECRDLSAYWSAPALPFLIMADEEWAGFALVDRNPTPRIDFWMGEFFVLRKFRRRGIGGSAARLVFNRLRGSWMVGQMMVNKPAIEFWRSVIADYTAGRFAEAVRRVDHLGAEMNVFEFRNKELESNGL
jgi:predicted acetyltransferase